VQARNQADAMVHSVKKSLAEHGDKLDAGEKGKIEAALKDAEEAIKGDDKATIEAKTEALMTASQKLGEKVYAEPRQAAAGAAGGAGGARRPRRRRPCGQAGRRQRGRRRVQGSQEVNPGRRPSGCRWISPRSRTARPCLHLQRGGLLSVREFHGKARLLRRPRRAQERHRRRHQEGLPQAGHEAPPRPQPG
jgi:hypothetical protein